jgi:hypothetical protein
LRPWTRCCGVSSYDEYARRMHALLSELPETSPRWDRVLAAARRRRRRRVAVIALALGIATLVAIGLLVTSNAHARPDWAVTGNPIAVLHRAHVHHRVQDGAPLAVGQPSRSTRATRHPECGLERGDYVKVDRARPWPRAAEPRERSDSRRASCPAAGRVSHARGSPSVRSRNRTSGPLPLS